MGHEHACEICLNYGLKVNNYRNSDVKFEVMYEILPARSCTSLINSFKKGAGISGGGGSGQGRGGGGV